MVFAPPGGISFGVWVKLRLTVRTPAGETACCELMTTKQLADPQEASTARLPIGKLNRVSHRYRARRRIDIANSA
ncbi:MAG TPA: hypothetical protein DDY39_12940 [Nitrospira sp.]|nr:hypothetical protein [Nitrospira sp.]